jgi:hypothetical protein
LCMFAIHSGVLVASTSPTPPNIMTMYFISASSRRWEMPDAC